MFKIPHDPRIQIVEHRKPILPIAIFSYNNMKEVDNQFSLEIPTFKILEFNYLPIHLIKMNWRKYIYQDNPVIAALLSKMGYTQDERIQVKLEFLRMLSKLELNPAKMDLIYGFFETYLKLNAEEEEKMREEITHLPEEEAKQVLKPLNSYFEKGMERGIERGQFIKGKEIVKKMLQKGMDMESIMEFTGLSKGEISKIAAEIKNGDWISCSSILCALECSKIAN